MMNVYMSFSGIFLIFLVVHPLATHIPHKDQDMTQLEHTSLFQNTPKEIENIYKRALVSCPTMQ